MASCANASANVIRARTSRSYRIFKNEVFYSKYTIKIQFICRIVCHINIYILNLHKWSGYTFTSCLLESIRSRYKEFT